MPNVIIFSSDKERRKYMKGKQFTWFLTLEYEGRNGLEYRLNFII